MTAFGGQLPSTESPTCLAPLVPPRPHELSSGKVRSLPLSSSMSQGDSTGHRAVFSSPGSPCGPGAVSGPLHVAGLTAPLEGSTLTLGALLAITSCSLSLKLLLLSQFVLAQDAGFAPEQRCTPRTCGHSCCRTARLVGGLCPAWCLTVCPDTACLQSALAFLPTPRLRSEGRLHWFLPWLSREFAKSP